MSNFITTGDYSASIHNEILNSITRNDDAVIEICEERAIDEMRSYMSGRYDCDKIFMASGEQRNQLVLMMALDITIYHLFCLHNPQKLSPMRKDRYDRAVEWLKAVRRGDISPSGLILSDENKKEKSPFQMRGNKKLITRL